MIQMRTLTQGSQGRGLIPELGVAISRDSTIELRSYLEHPLRKTQRSCGRNFKVFEWIQKISLDALGYLPGLGLERERKVKNNTLL